MMFEGVPGLAINTGPKPQLRVAEPGQRIRVERVDFTIEGLVTAAGFDPMRGNWIRLSRDDGEEVTIQEMVRLNFTIVVLDEGGTP